MSHGNGVGGAGRNPHQFVGQEVEWWWYQIQFDRLLQIIGHLQSGADRYKTPSGSFQSHSDDDQDAVEFLLACPIV